MYLLLRKVPFSKLSFFLQWVPDMKWLQLQNTCPGRLTVDSLFPLGQDYSLPKMINLFQTCGKALKSVKFRCTRVWRGSQSAKICFY